MLSCTPLNEHTCYHARPLLELSRSNLVPRPVPGDSHAFFLVIVMVPLHSSCESSPSMKYAVVRHDHRIRSLRVHLLTPNFNTFYGSLGYPDFIAALHISLTSHQNNSIMFDDDVRHALANVTAIGVTRSSCPAPFINALDYPPRIGSTSRQEAH
jgi:hypothetical protein